MGLKVNLIQKSCKTKNNQFLESHREPVLDTLISLIIENMNIP